MFNPLSFL